MVQIVNQEGYLKLDEAELKQLQEAEAEKEEYTRGIDIAEITRAVNEQQRQQEQQDTIQSRKMDFDTRSLGGRSMRSMSVLERGVRSKSMWGIAMFLAAGVIVVLKVGGANGVVNLQAPKKRTANRDD